MRSSKTLIVLATICLGLAGCSSAPGADAWRFTSGTARIAHNLEKLPTGKNKLVVSAVPGPGQSQDSVDQQARGFAYDFAKSVCPKGFDFFADTPLEKESITSAAGHQRTYIFQCR